MALPGELGGLRERVVGERELGGLRILEVDAGVPGTGLLACVGGVGKVRAAGAAMALLASGAEAGLLVVGVAGALRRGLGPGDLVHCARAVQADLAVREDRDVAADAALLAAWRAEVPGPAGWFVTADRPVLSPWRRLRLARAFLGTAVADMETAAVAAVAARAGRPFAALRAVSDHAGFGAGRVFQHHYPRVGGLAADTVPGFLARLAGAPAPRKPHRAPSDPASPAATEPSSPS